MKNRPLLICSLILILGFSFAQCSKKDTVTGLPSINSDNDKAVGASANNLLSAAGFQSVKLEIQYMPGFQPDPAVVTNLTSFLNTLINKPGGITVSQTMIAASGKSSLSLNEIATIEKNNRTAFNSGSQLAVYLLFTDAGYSEPNVLGIAYRNTSVCMMGKTINDNSGGIGQASRIKLASTVVEHEMAHLLGLVDIGTAMQTAHKDAAHGNHCNNSNCLMYYASETTDILGFLITGNIPTLDANCGADLVGNGGK